MARQRSCMSLWRRSPPEWAEPSGYISVRFAIGSQMSSPSATTTTSSLTDPRSLLAVEMPRSWTQRPLLWLNPPPFQRHQHCSSSGPAPLQPSGIAYAASKRANGVVANAQIFSKRELPLLRFMQVSAAYR